MSTVAIVLIVLGALLLLLFIGGLIAAARRARSLDPQLRARIVAANEQLAAAHAADRGWERATLEQTARAAFSEANPGTGIDSLHLVQVVDMPGTDADEAVFHVIAGGTAHSLRLGRRDSAWVAV